MPKQNQTMAKWTKRILITLGVLIVLLLAAAIILPIVFKDKIEAAVKAEVNKNINAMVDWGEWDITILRSFPDLTVTVADVKVANVAPFEGIELARIGSLTATVDIKSVFGDKIDIKRIGLIKPRIHVKVLEDGTANWDIAKADTTAVTEPADTASAFNIGLREYSIEDGLLIYDDASLTYYMDLRGLDHTGSGDFTQDLFTLSTVTHADSANVVFDGIRYLKNVKADITADLDMDLPNMKFTFKENEATINQLVLGFDGWLAMPAEDIDMDLTWSAKKTDFATLLSLVPAEFAGNLDGVSMSGKAGFSGHVKGRYNDTSMPGFGVVVDVDNGRFKYPDLPAAVEDIFVDLKVNSPGGSDMDGMVVDLKRFAMKMAGNPVEARMHLTTPISDPNVDAELKAKLDLASVKQVVPMKEELKGRLNADVRMKGRMSDVEAQRYEQFTADGELILQDMHYAADSMPAVGISNLHFDFTPKFLELVAFNGTVGSSNVQAKGRMDNYLQWWLKDSTLTGSFDLAADKFDLNELMGASTETAPATPADTTPMSVIEVPANINFRMGMTVKEVIYDNLALTNVRGGLHVHERRVDFNDVFFNLFNGSVAMEGDYDTKDAARPRFDLRYDVRDMDIEKAVTYIETIQKMAPIAKTCKGTFSTDLSMQAHLDQHMNPDLNTMTGRGTLRTKNVRVEGFQPLVDVAKALKIKEIENTTLQDVNFTYRFQDGKMITDPFDVKIDRIKANVGGSTAFADQAIDYLMKAKVPTAMFGAAAARTAGSLLGEANRFLGANMKVPEELDATIKITGTVDKPIVKPMFAGGSTNVGDVIKEEIKQEVNEQISKAKEEAIAKAREEAARLVAEAQKQADQLKADARREAARLKGEAYAAADKLVNDAKDPISKAAARVGADKLKKEADKKEQQAIAEADKRADGLVETARKKGDDLIQKAEATDTTVK
ncbi:MAG TPA: AsmA-like C-terminal region-containing protein [Flavobacteriales bacterium]|nr:AsmA-like C-terminal region-containing protein [Flavobacteriales bacterium]